MPASEPRDLVSSIDRERGLPIKVGAEAQA
jgi:hypothetical protein